MLHVALHLCESYHMYITSFDWLSSAPRLCDQVFLFQHPSEGISVVYLALVKVMGDSLHQENFASNKLYVSPQGKQL